jgi:hypothetical protein
MFRDGGEIAHRHARRAEGGVVDFSIRRLGAQSGGDEWGRDDAGSKLLEKSAAFDGMGVAHGELVENARIVDKSDNPRIANAQVKRGGVLCDSTTAV